MSLYYDAGVIVKLYAREDLSDVVTRQGHAVVVNRLHEIEMRNALRLKRFRDEIDAGQLAASLGMIATDFPGNEPDRPSAEAGMTAMLAVAAGNVRRKVAEVAGDRPEVKAWIMARMRGMYTGMDDDDRFTAEDYGRVIDEMRAEAEAAKAPPKTRRGGRGRGRGQHVRRGRGKAVFGRRASQNGGPAAEAPDTRPDIGGGIVTAPTIEDLRRALDNLRATAGARRRIRAGRPLRRRRRR